MLLFCCQTAILAQNTEGGIQFIHDNYNEAIAKAKSEKKIIFLDAYTTWCGPCKMMSKLTFTVPEVGSFFNKNFVNLKFDMEKGDGPMLQQKFDVVAYPTLLFIDSSGKLVHKALGYQDVPSFLEIGKTALDGGENSLSFWTKRYEKGDTSVSFLKNYALKLSEAYDVRCPKVVEEYLATQADWCTDENLEFIYRFTDVVDKKLFPFLVKNKQAFEKKVNAAEIDGKIQGMVADKIFNEKNLPTLGFADSLIQLVYPEKFDRMSKKYRMDFNRMKGDRAEYAQAAVKYFKKYDDSAAELSDISSIFVEQIDDKKMLKKALDWAKRSVKLDNSYLNNLTVAQLFKKLDKKPKAEKAAQKAIEIAKKNSEDVTEAEALLKELKELPPPTKDQVKTNN